MRYFTRFLLVVSVFSFWGNATFSQEPETFGQSTFHPMNLFIVDATINGETLQPGSEIQVFDIDPNSGNQICVGSVLIQQEFSQGSFTQLKASMDDGFLPDEANGSTPGNDMIFKYFLPSVGLIENVTVTFPFANYDYTFQPRGLAIVALSATAPTTLYSVTLVSDPIDGGTIGGGGIYLEGTSITINAIAENGYRFNAWIENELVVSDNPEYTFQVDSGRALIADFECLWNPPKNLQAEVDQNNVTLTWEPPDFSVEGEWKHWDNGVNSFAIGKDFGGTFRFAAKWDNLFSYSGWFVNKVAFFPKYDAEFNLLVWTGDNATNLVVNQAVANVIPEQWNEVFLENPVPINIFEELWVGFECTHDINEYPAGCDNGPANPLYGDLISFDGQTWKSLKYNYNVNRDWNIQVWIEHDVETKNLPERITDKGLEPGQPREEISFIETKPSVFSPQTRTEFLGYDLFRNDVRIANAISANTYTDLNLAPGIYYYYIQSVFDQGSSKAVGPAEAEINSWQTIGYALPKGWSGFSTLVNPDQIMIEEVFSQVGDTLLALQDLSTFYNLSGDTINSRTGYFVKVSDSCSINLSGKTINNRILALSAGWNLIPSITEIEITPSELAFTGNYKIIIEAATNLVFWPEHNIHLLETIKPGKAYMIFMLTDGSIEFPNFTNN